MAAHKLPIWSCIHVRASSNTPPEVVRLLSQVKFNGKNNSSAFNHALQFIQSVSSSNVQRIDEGILCRIFTFTFTAEARKWCRTLPVASIHSWDQFVKAFICKFDCYDYDQVYDEIEYLRKEDEFVRDFNMRFHLDCLKYDLENELMNEESLDYAEHSLPPMSDPSEISPSLVLFSSNRNENSNLNLPITHDEETSQSLGNMPALMQEDKSENVERKPALEPERNLETMLDNIIASQQMQTPRLEQQINSLSENTNTQRYDLKPDVYNERDEQEFFHDDIFKCIVSESHNIL